MSRQVLQGFLLLLLLVTAGVSRGAEPPAPSPATDAFNSAVAYATPMEPIRVDGEIDDWPKDAARYPVMNNFGVYGPSHADGLDLSTDNRDLHAYFMVGYNTRAGHVYVVVVVRDNEHIPWFGALETDAVEVYFDGLHAKRQAFGEVEFRVPSPVGQYVAIAGEGGYQRGSNPSLNLGRGNFDATGSKFAWSRHGDRTIYEWAITVCDNYEAREATALTPGKRMGFDVVVVDKDSPRFSSSAWIAWGPTAGGKYRDGKVLGDVVLVEDAATLGSVSGRLIASDDGKPWAGGLVEFARDGERAGFAAADAKGVFTMRLPKGRYTVWPARMQGIAKSDPVAFDVTAGKETSLDLKATPIPIPDALNKALTVYAGMKSYADTSTTLSVEDREGGNPGTFVPYRFAFERPGKVRIDVELPNNLGNASVVTDGKFAGLSDPRPVAMNGLDRFLIVEKLSFGALAAATRTLTAEPVARPTDRHLLVNGPLPHRFLLADDPTRELRRGLDAIETLGEASIEGKPATIVELTRATPSLMTGNFMGSRVGHLTRLRAWITNADGLIRKTEFQLSEVDIRNGAFMAGNYYRPYVFTSTHKGIRVNEPIAPNVFELPPPRPPAKLDVPIE